MSGSCLKTPVPGSFKHAPMIVGEKQIDLLLDIEPGMDVFSLDENHHELSNTYDDKMDNDEIVCADDIKDEIEDYEQDHDHDDGHGLLQMDDDDDDDDEVGMEYIAYNKLKSNYNTNRPPHLKIIPVESYRL